MISRGCLDTCAFLYLLSWVLACALYPRFRKLQRGRLVPCAFIYSYSQETQNYL